MTPHTKTPPIHWCIVVPACGAGQAHALAPGDRRAGGRLPPDRRRDGQPRARRRADDLGAGDGLEVTGRVRAGVPSDDTNLVRRARPRRAPARVVIDKRIPPGGGLGGGSADAAAVLRWTGFDDLVAARRLGADIPFCMVGGRARVTGIGEVVEPLPRSIASSLSCPPVRRVDTRGLPGLGRARRPEEPSVATISSRRRSPSSRGWSPGGARIFEVIGARRFSPAAVRPGSSTARMPTLARCPLPDARCRRGAHRPPVAARAVGAAASVRLLVATLVARAAKHLLVLLLAHALAALLDQRTHEEETLPDPVPPHPALSKPGASGAPLLTDRASGASTSASSERREAARAGF